MPCGQKNKHRKHMKNKNRSPKKCHNKRDGYQDHKGAVDSEGVEEKPPCSSFSVLVKISEKLCASEPSSDTERPSCVPACVPVAICSHENEYCHGARNLLYSECRLCHDNPCRSCVDMNVVFVEQCVLYKFKMKQLITREDLLNVIDPHYRYRFDEIFKRAFENIETVFAVNVMEIDSTNHLYDLVSKIKLPNKGRVCPGRGLPKTGLLMILLAMIFMKGNSVAEKEVWKFLNMMQVYAGRKHFIYRDPWKLINQDLVKLKYLEYRLIPNSDPPCYEYLWGPKAYTETTKMKVLEFMAKGSGIEPNIFLVQYAEALKEENQKVQEKISPGSS